MKDNHNVFINCPFDKKYQSLEDAIIFTILDCGFKPRSAKESSASGDRLSKIQSIIRDCSFAIHDISRTDPDPKNNLPRFNMPFELGLFLGAKYFGGKIHDGKQCLIFDREHHRFLKFISDLRGHDIKIHKDKAKRIVDPVRDFLAEIAKNQGIKSGSDIYKRYLTFQEWLAKTKVNREKKSFGEFSHIISKFLMEIKKWH